MQSKSMPATVSGGTVGHGWVLPSQTATDTSVSFIREHWLTITLASVVLAVPCFWHRHLIAGDLGSHIYNVWLVHLIKHEHVSSLQIVGQWTNVLFDRLLGGLAAIFPLSVASKIAALRISSRKGNLP